MCLILKQLNTTDIETSFFTVLYFHVLYALVCVLINCVYVFPFIAPTTSLSQRLFDWEHNFWISNRYTLNWIFVQPGWFGMSLPILKLGEYCKMVINNTHNGSLVPVHIYINMFIHFCCLSFSTGIALVCMQLCVLLWFVV